MATFKEKKDMKRFLVRYADTQKEIDLVENYSKAVRIKDRIEQLPGSKKGNVEIVPIGAVQKRDRAWTIY